MPEIATTKTEREIIRHSLFGSSRSTKPFRNHFCAEAGSPDAEIINGLIAKGLMFRGRTINNGQGFYAHVTEAGADEIGAKLPEGD